jgi:hypothetical protein
VAARRSCAASNTSRIDSIVRLRQCPYGGRPSAHAVIVGGFVIVRGSEHVAYHRVGTGCPPYRGDYWWRGEIVRGIEHVM